MRVYAAFVTWLAEQGHTVVLFATDAADRGAVNDLQHRLRPDTLAKYGMRIQHAYVDTVHGLVDELSRMDCVVASRLHTVILTHVLGLPVLAIAHDRKVLAHMNDLRQLRHCVEIEELETAELERGFADLNAWLPEAAATIYAATELCRRSVVAQYEHVFALTGWARERSRKPTLAAPARSLASADPVPRL
jgi:polysaccharide pyruvyl transferase WcaK-like protein